MSECFTCQIRGNEFIGDSLDKINNNFINMLTVACMLSAELRGVTSFGVTSVSGVSMVRSELLGSVYTLTSVICPQWHIGLTNNPLLLEPVASRISQQVSNQVELQDYIESIAINTPVYTDIISRGISTPSVAFPGSNTYRKGVLLFDGRVFFLPYNTTGAACLYDPEFNTISNLTGFVSVNRGYFGGVLLPDGRVFCIPHNASTAIIYKHNSSTPFTYIGTFPGGQSFLGGTLLPNGSVLLSPYNNSIIRIFNTVTSTSVDYPITTGTYTNKAIYGCILGSDGNVYFVSNTSTNLWWFDTGANIVGSLLSVFPAIADAYRGAVRMADGRIFFVPYNSTRAAIIDTTTSPPTVSLTASVFPGSGAYETGTLLPDGRIFLCPANATKPSIYDPYNDTVQDINISLTPNNYHGCILLGTGEILILPNSASSGILIKTPYERNFNANALTSPYFNKL